MEQISCICFWLGNVELALTPSISLHYGYTQNHNQKYTLSFPARHNIIHGWPDSIAKLRTMVTKNSVWPVNKFLDLNWVNLNCWNLRIVHHQWQMVTYNTSDENCGGLSILIFASDSGSDKLFIAAVGILVVKNLSHPKVSHWLKFAPLNRFMEKLLQFAPPDHCWLCLYVVQNVTVFSPVWFDIGQNELIVDVDTGWWQASTFDDRINGTSTDRAFGPGSPVDTNPVFFRWRCQWLLW